MRVDGRRTKKLIVAFHFQSSRQAGWRCGDCRRQGLEEKRRCGWLPESRRGARRLVWVGRGRAATEECPKSLVTAQSIEWLEWFFTWKFSGGGDVSEMAARDADAILTLEREWRTNSNAQE